MSDNNEAMLNEAYDLDNLAKALGGLDSFDMEKIKELQKIQANMADFLIDRFAANIEAFKKHMPDVAKTFENYRPKKTMEFFCTGNGIPNLEFIDTHNIVYKTLDPFALCRIQIEYILKENGLSQIRYDPEWDPLGQIHFKYENATIKIEKSVERNRKATIEELKSVPNCFMFGVGLGYQLSELYQRVEIANLILVEPDLDMFFASLHTFAWDNLLDYLEENHFGIHLMLGQTPEQFYIDMEQYYKMHGRFLSGSYLGIVHSFTKEIREIAKVIKKEYTSVHTGLGFFDDHLFGASHACNAIVSGKHFVDFRKKLDKKYKNLPVFIIGSGPSLDNDIPFLRKNQDKAIIIACGTAVDTLYHAGIKPDFYACTERTPEIRQALDVIPDKHFFDDIILLASDVVHPNTLDKFTHTAIFGKLDEPFYTFAFRQIKEIQNIKLIQMMNPLVGNLGVSGALYLGFENLYLFGLDNGKKYGTESIHSKYTALYQKHGTSDKGGSYVTDALVEGNFGGPFETGYYFKIAARNIGFILGVFQREFKNVTCHNCADGVKIDNTIPKHSYDLNFDNRAVIDKSKFRDYINNELTTRINVNMEELEALFDHDLFDSVISRLQNVLEKKATSRTGYVQLFEMVSEIITDLHKMEKTSFIGDCVDGTLQTIFIIATRTLYNSLDEELVLSKVSEIIDIAIEFLEEAKILYKHTPHYIIGEHHKYYENGMLGIDTKRVKAPPLPSLIKLKKNDYVDPQQVFEKRYE